MEKIALTGMLLLLTSHSFAQSAKASLSASNSTHLSTALSDVDYSLISSFKETQTPAIEKSIVETFGQSANRQQNISIWFAQGIYTITLRPGKLTIDLDKRKATEEITKKFDALAERIQNTHSLTN